MRPSSPRPFGTPPRHCTLPTMTLRKRVYRALDFEEDEGGLDRFVGFALLVLITLNVVAVIVESIPEVHDGYATLFTGFELLSVLIFTAEYLLRIWSCVEEDHFSSHPVRGRVQYMLSPLGLIDLAAIAPFYMADGLNPEMGLHNSFRAARIFRLFALLRVLKIGRYSSAVGTLGRVLRDKREELVISAALGGMLLLCSSAIMYMLERDANPKSFSSIPAAMWWGITTLTTVGYGDATPITAPGKLVAGFIQVLGLIMFALPSGVLAGGFMDELKRQRSDSAVCPHCGGSLHQH